MCTVFLSITLQMYSNLVFKIGIVISLNVIELGENQWA